MEVKLFDIDNESLDRGLVKIRKNLEHLQKSGLADRTTIAKAQNNLKPVDSIAELVANVELVHESTSEY